jgi:hypothetical protein
MTITPVGSKKSVLAVQFYSINTPALASGHGRKETYRCGARCAVCYYIIQRDILGLIEVRALGAAIAREWEWYRGQYQSLLFQGGRPNTAGPEEAN